MKRLRLLSIFLILSSSNSAAIANEYQLFMMAGPNNYTKASFVFVDYETCVLAGQDWVKQKKVMIKGIFVEKLIGKMVLHHMKSQISFFKQIL